MTTDWADWNPAGKGSKLAGCMVARLREPSLTLDNTIAPQYYVLMPILSFRCPDTQRLFGGQRVRRLVNIESVAMRKLAMLNRVQTLDDLRVPPGNRLEALKGSRAGQHSIRVNEQFRVCFVWTRQGPKDVEIVDYH